MKPLYLRKAKVNVKSLAAEATFIRKEANEILVPEGSAQISELTSHRTNGLRAEARASQLAYGFLRGRKYKQIEEKTKKDFPETAIHRKLMSWGVPGRLWNVNQTMEWFVGEFQLTWDKKEAVT